MDRTYKQAIEDSMTMLAQDPLTRFVGYGLLKGRNGCGLRNVRDEQICEFTVAEGLMTSAAIGMALTGLKPVVLIERADFIWNAMDAIVNHLDACATISNYEFNPAILIRVIIGNKHGPLFTGHTHTQDNHEAVKRAVRFPVWKVRTPDEVMTAWEVAYKNLSLHSTIVYEEKDRTQGYL